MIITLAALCAATAAYGMLTLPPPLRAFNKEHFETVAADPPQRLTLSEAALCLELMSALLGAGTSLGQAMHVLGQQQPQLAPLIHVSRGLDHGLSWQDAWTPHLHGPGWNTLAKELRFVHLSAAPTAGMLVAAAAQLRNYESFHIRERSQQLSSRLVLPTGLLSLPAFICWGILPAVIALFGEIHVM